MGKIQTKKIPPKDGIKKYSLRLKLRIIEISDSTIKLTCEQVKVFAAAPFSNARCWRVKVVLNPVMK